MKWNMLHQISLLAFVFIFLNGCTVVETFKQNYKETAEVYSPPKNLEANILDTGILMVDAVTKKPLNTMSLSGVAIANIKEPGKEILFGSFNKGGFLSSSSGVVIIPNLHPGTYRIVKIKTENANMWETQYMATTKEFEVEIIAGKPVYFGQIQMKQRFGSRNKEISIQYDKKREAKSWKMVVEKYSKSPWIPIIDAHIKGLE